MIDKVLGHYRIVSKLGEGGMGVVYRARDQVLQRDVALKFLGETLGREARQFLLREARAASALSHPNICTVHEVGEADGEFYIVMELIEGKPLSVSIGTGGLPYESVMRYGAQIAGALTHAHGRNIVHRDLKSANVIVTPEGLVKVLDFGLARRLAAAQDEGTRTMRHAGIRWPRPAARCLTCRRKCCAASREITAATCGRSEWCSMKPWRVRCRFTGGQLSRSAPPSCMSRRHLCPPGYRPAWRPSFNAAWRKSPRCAISARAKCRRRSRQFNRPAPRRSLRAISADRITTVHRGIKHLQVKNGDVLLLVGTTKGVFLLRSSAQRARWDVAGPYFHGQATYALAYDSREGRHRLWASTFSMLWGAFLRSSDDYGRTWTNPQEAPIRFPADSGATLKNIWQICLGRPEEPNVIYCGVEPAALYESRDDGETWSLVRGLFDHPHRPRWMPGLGGLALHTILLDSQNPERMYVAISAGGVYATEDGGRTWQARNRGIRVVHMPEKYPEFGQCVHKIVMHPSRPERLFLQNHWGLYRSDNQGESWQDIAHGVPSDFGFAMVVHPHNPDCVYILPIESDEFRCTPEGRLRVYRTRNAGESWEPLTRGLPQKGAYETVLRDAMTADSLDPVGIYFGTRSGQLYGSADEGKTWKKILEGLPPVVCVKSAVVGERRVSGAARETRPTASEKRSSSRGKSKLGRKR